MIQSLNKIKIPVISCPKVTVRRGFFTLETFLLNFHPVLLLHIIEITFTFARCFSYGLILSGNPPKALA